MKLEKRICEWKGCGKVFEPTGLRQKYCDKCRLKSIREYQRKYKIKVRNKLVEVLTEQELQLLNKSIKEFNDTGGVKWSKIKEKISG
jgi:hypothetical protein